MHERDTKLQINPYELKMCIYARVTFDLNLYINRIIGRSGRRHFIMILKFKQAE